VYRETGAEVTDLQVQGPSRAPMLGPAPSKCVAAGARGFCGKISAGPGFGGRDATCGGVKRHRAGTMTRFCDCTYESRHGRSHSLARGIATMMLLLRLNEALLSANMLRNRKAHAIAMLVRIGMHDGTLLGNLKYR
jgi:hypothetical protein